MHALLGCQPQSDHMHSNSSLKVNSCWTLMLRSAPTPSYRFKPARVLSEVCSKVCFPDNPCVFSLHLVLHVTSLYGLFSKHGNGCAIRKAFPLDQMCFVFHLGIAMTFQSSNGALLQKEHSDRALSTSEYGRHKGLEGRRKPWSARQIGNDSLNRLLLAS